MSLFSQQVIGVDIGHASVKVVGLSLGHRPKFIGCKEIPVDPKYLQKEGFTDPALVGSAIREALRGASPRAITSKLAYASVGESQLFRKVIELPVIADREQLDNAVRLEVSQYLPEGIDTMELDFQEFGLLPDGKGLQVMVVAVPKKTVEQYLAIFAAAKLNLKALDVRSAALGRAVVPREDQDAILLVAIGSEISSISVYQAGVTRVSSTINLGGNIVRDPETGEVDESRQEELVKRLVSNVVDEIDHVVKFYANRTAAHIKIKEIRLVGGGSMIPGVVDQIKEGVGIPLVAAEPIIPVPPFCDRKFFAALGCALYPVNQKGV